MSKLFLAFEPSNHIYRVISAAKRRGFSVVVFHTLALDANNAYGFDRSDVAEEYVLDSWADHAASFARIVAACGRREVVGTYAAHESLLELEARVQEHFGVPTKSVAFIRRYLDKVNVRDEIRRHGLTRLRTFDAHEFAAMTSWPFDGSALYFKPVHGTASAYVRRCTSLTEARAAVQCWERDSQPCGDMIRQHLKSGSGYFFEEEAVGELMSLEGYVDRGEYRALGLCSRTVLKRDITIELGATFPYPHPAYDAIVAKVNAIHRALRVPHGATHTEVIVSPDGGVELVELNLRFAGADVLLLADAAYHTAIEEILVDLAVGNTPNAVVPKQPRCYASVHYLLPPVGATVFESIELAEANLIAKKMIRPLGTLFHANVAQADMMAGFITCAGTYEAAVREASRIRRTVRINGQAIEADPNNVVIAR